VEVSLPSAIHFVELNSAEELASEAPYGLKQNGSPPSLKSLSLLLLLI